MSTINPTHYHKLEEMHPSDAVTLSCDLKAWALEIADLADKLDPESRNTRTYHAIRSACKNLQDSLDALLGGQEIKE